MALDNCCETGARSGGFDHDPECRKFDAAVAAEHAKNHRIDASPIEISRIECRFCGFRFIDPSAFKDGMHCPRCRDQFAMAALTVMLLNRAQGFLGTIASDAYIIADAMLEARKVATDPAKR